MPPSANASSAALAQSSLVSLAIPVRYRMDANHTAAYGHPMIVNIHERIYPASPAQLADLLARIAEPPSPMWPRRWPPMLLDRPLSMGARGGHGPIRYHCTAYEPNHLAEFTFTMPTFKGTHTFEILGPTLRHTLRAHPHGIGRLVWPVALRWLHDACLEDLLDHTADSLGHPPPTRTRWSPYVRLLRRLATLQPRPNTAVTTTSVAP
jgi:hypothetical protein